MKKESKIIAVGGAILIVAILILSSNNVVNIRLFGADDAQLIVGTWGITPNPIVHFTFFGNGTGFAYAEYSRGGAYQQSTEIQKAYDFKWSISYNMLRLLLFVEPVIKDAAFVQSFYGTLDLNYVMMDDDTFDIISYTENRVGEDAFAQAIAPSSPISSYAENEHFVFYREKCDVVVNVQPLDAQIKINGQPISSAYKTGMPINIEVSKPFFYPMNKTIVLFGSSETISMLLQPVERYSVKFTTSPSTCYITIEGTSVTGDDVASQTKTTEPGFVTFNNIYRGTYTVTVAKDGYSTIVKTLAFPITKTDAQPAGVGLQEYKFTLQQIPQKVQGTPGFEMLGVVAAIGIAMIILKRRKK